MKNLSLVCLFSCFAGSAHAQEASADVDGSSTLPDCPPLIRVLGKPPGDAFACSCTPEIQRVQGTVKVYGSGPYESSSNICLAAIHAGATPREGGPVRVVPREPMSRFEGSEANGMITAHWGVSLFNTFDVEPLGQ